MPANNLVYDFGLHKGEDTDFYLRKGFQVIAVEANPALVAAANIRFKDEIAAGRLKIIEGAIAPTSAGDNPIFYVNPEVSVWGTIDPSWAIRNEQMGHKSTQIEVARVDVAGLFRSYGVPYYMKVDIEGADQIAIEDIGNSSERPDYVSLETSINFVSDMNVLRRLGYRRFKIVQQQTIPGSKIKTHRLDGEIFEYTFEPDASGPFGDDLPGPWLTFHETINQHHTIFRTYKLFGDFSPIRKMPRIVQRAARLIYRIGTGHKGPLPGWFDVHASL